MTIPPEEPEEPPTQDRNRAALEAFDEVTGLNELRMLPAILVGAPIAIAIFIAVAAVLALAYVGIYQAFHPTGAIGAALGLAWFGGSLAVTAFLLRRVLRRISAFLQRRKLPTIY